MNSLIRLKKKQIVGLWGWKKQRSYEKTGWTRKNYSGGHWRMMRVTQLSMANLIRPLHLLRIYGKFPGIKTADSPTERAKGRRWELLTRPTNQTIVQYIQ